MSNKVAVAMSGGVDSSVTAALCVEEYGKENVFGITMKLFCYGESDSDEKNCCSIEAVNDARAVCDQLGITHYTVSMEREFEKKVIDNFVEEYQSGRTPNPCVRCNQLIKFDALLKKAMELGADLLATGHYSRVIRERSKNKSQKPNNDPIFKYQLLKGVDEKKDQSYFLYNLTQEQLAHVIFPLGDIDKSETRKIAAKYNLVTAKKTESQEICFVTNGSVADYLKPKVKYVPGDILNSQGDIIGKHEGLPFYTIGQRKGLGGGFPDPLFVIAVDIEKNTLIVGKKEELSGNKLTVFSVNWIQGSDLKFPLNCEAKIRYNMEEQACHVGPQMDGSNIQNYTVVFKNQQRSITPGQSIVFFDGEVCLGGGIIQ